MVVAGGFGGFGGFGALRHGPHISRWAVRFARTSLQEYRSWTVSAHSGIRSYRFNPIIRDIPSSIFPISVSDIEPILSASRVLSIERTCSHRATDPPFKPTFKYSMAGAEVERGTTTTVFRALLSGLIERTTTGRIFRISDPTVGSSRAQNTSPRAMAGVIFGIARKAWRCQKSRWHRARP